MHPEPSGLQPADRNLVHVTKAQMKGDRGLGYLDGEGRAGAVNAMLDYVKRKVKKKKILENPSKTAD